MHPMKRSAALTALALACLSAQAATINITSRDPAGVGFNDTTPVAPVGGNPGTTLGEQRMNVYRHVANIWEQNLASNVTITVSAGWEALTCTASSAVLGSAGAWNIWHDFPGGKPGTWYPQALANKIAGVNLSAGNPDDGSGFGNVDIKTQFNVNLGNANCLAGSPFYLGLDGNTGGKVNFVETLLHELGHGLGFSVLSVRTSTGMRLLGDGSAFSDAGLPSVWEQHMYDNTTGKTWLNMTSLERKASAVNPLKLAWTGSNAASGATLLKNIPVMQVGSNKPGDTVMYDYNTASFGAVLPKGTLGVLANVDPQEGELGNGCSPFNVTNTAHVHKRVALIQRGGCTFASKVKNAQNAGAIGVVLFNNVDAPLAPGGSDPTITIPVAGLTKAEGLAIRASIPGDDPAGAQTRSGVVSVAFSSDPTRRAGADSAGRPLLYTPSTLAPGSSVSHWDVTASPNLLMEPSINADLGTVLTTPKDLTVPLLKDIGW